MKRIIKDTDSLYILPLTVFAGLVPLIVSMKAVPLEGIVSNYWFGQDFSYDLFSYYKMVWILISASSAVFIFLVNYFKRKAPLSFSDYTIPSGIYMLLVIASSLSSQYRNIAVFGFVERYEGMYVIIAYVIMMLIAAYFIKSEKQAALLARVIFVSAALIGLIGVFQYAGMNFFQSAVGKFFIIPASYRNNMQINFPFGAYNLFSTLYNSNYVGSYMAMLLPLSVAVFISCRKKILRIIMGILSCLTLVNLIGCNSKAGFLGAVLALIVLVAVLIRKVLKNWKPALVLLVCFILIYAGMGAIAKERSSKPSGQLFSMNNELKQVVNPGEKISIREVIQESHLVKIVFDRATLQIKDEPDKMDFMDGSGRPLKYKDSLKKDSAGRPVFVFDNSSFNGVSFSFDDSQGTLILKVNNLPISFRITSEGFRLLDQNGNPTELRNVEKWNIGLPERAGSGRVYIWSRSLPLIKKTVLIGFGPDTFAIDFPQDDYIGKFNNIDDIKTLVDKPHNFYIQVAISTGLVSLLALLVLFCMYIFRSGWIYIKKNGDSIGFFLGAGCFAAVCGYLVAAVFNDSVVSVAPVFWTLLGMGIALNRLQGQKPDEVPVIGSKQTESPRAGSKKGGSQINRNRKKS